MQTTIQTESGKRCEIDLFFSNTFKGRGGWNINLKANWNGENFETHIYTTNTHFIDELSYRKAEGESWDIIQEFYGENFLPHFENDLKKWADELESRGAED